MMDVRIATEELLDYFGRSEGDAGLRSPLGYQLAMHEAGIEFDRSFPRTDDNMVAMVDRKTSHARVHRRLGRLSGEHQAILAAAYGDVMPVAGSDVSVSLAIGTETARTGHAASIQGAKDRIAKAPEAQHKGDWGRAVTTTREWLGWLCLENDGPRARMLAEILDEARRLRDHALDAYCAADEKSEAA